MLSSFFISVFINLTNFMIFVANLRNLSACFVADFRFVSQHYVSVANYFV